MASAPEEKSITTPSAKKTLLNLPSETIASIFEHTTDHDLAQLCRVSKHLRELAAAELYHTLNHTFIEEPVSQKRSIDYLAGFLETLATSDYNYAGHIKRVSMDTGYAAGKGEQACRPFFYDLTCGKFFNTLLLALLKRTRALERFVWNVRIELSSAVFLQLHRMPNLRCVRIRLQAGQSLHAITKASAGSSLSVASLNTSPISPGPPPGTHSPGGGWAYSSPAAPSSSLRMVSKFPVTKPAEQPCSFSGFKNLKTLCVLDVDSLDYIPEIAESVRNSLDTLKRLELSLSNALARRAREKPRMEGSDGASSDDASTIASQPINAAEDGAPAGSNPEQMRQWHKNRQETILGKILATTSIRSNMKEVEAATNEIVSQAESESQNEERDNSDPSKDDEDQVFVKMMRAIFRNARSKQESSSKGAKTMEKIEKAATKYLEGRQKASDDMKMKPASKSSVIKIKTPKPPPINSWQGPHQPNNSFKSYSVHEGVLMDYFAFGKANWDQMNTLTKNHYVQTYFKETQGLNYQPYPMLPQAPGKSITHNNKVYYANPSSVPGYSGPSKYVVIPPKKAKKAPPPKSKYASDSDDQGKASKSPQAFGGETSVSLDPSSSPPAKVERDDFSNDPEILFPSEDEDQGPDQQFETDDEASGDERRESHLDMEELEQGINGAIIESGWLEDGEEPPAVAGKGKQAIRDPPNGHLTPPSAAPERIAATPEASGGKEEQDDPVSKYLRLSHGLPLEKLAIYLVPVKPATFLHHFDVYALKNLTLLNVGSQRRIWATLTKLQRQSPLLLSGVFTDNVTPALLTFLESLRAGQLEDLFLLERYLRRKGRMPQLQDCDKTTVDIGAIRKHVLVKHMKSLRRLVIRNDDSESWAVSVGTVRLIAREGVKLREMAIQCDTVTFHNVVRSLSCLPELYALQITFILDPGTPPVSMTGAATAPTSHHHHHYGGDGNGSVEPHTPASATMLQELRQCVIDGMSFSSDASQLELVGFSWLSSSGGGSSYLDMDGNPYVFLSRIIRDVDSGEGGSEWGGDETEDELEKLVDAETVGGGNSSGGGGANADGNAEGSGARDSTQKSTELCKMKATETEAVTNKDRPHPPPSFWSDDDLNITDVQEVMMWDKVIWSGRL